MAKLTMEEVCVQEAQTIEQSILTLQDLIVADMRLANTREDHNPIERARNMQDCINMIKMSSRNIQDTIGRGDD